MSIVHCDRRMHRNGAQPVERAGDLEPAAAQADDQAVYGRGQGGLPRGGGGQGLGQGLGRGRGGRGRGRA